MQEIDGIFYIAVLIMSIVVHEFSHGYSAYLLGDDTARLSGRLTLNPLKHLDPFGSVILPIILFLSTSGSFLVGWARPVPYNPANLKNERKGTFIVSLAGVLANILIAVIFGLLIKFSPSLGIASAPFYKIASIIVMVNLVLAIFNLIPIPPLDGSKILFSLLPIKYRYIENFLEKWGFVLLLVFIIFIWGKLAPFVYTLFSLITGIPLT